MSGLSVPHIHQADKQWFSLRCMFLTMGYFKHNFLAYLIHVFLFFSKYA